MEVDAERIDTTSILLSDVCPRVLSFACDQRSWGLCRITNRGMRKAAGVSEVVSSALKDLIPFGLRRVHGHIAVEDLTEASSEAIVNALLLATGATPECLALGIIEKVLRCCISMSQILSRVPNVRTPRTFEQVWMPTEESIIRISYAHTRASNRRHRLLPAKPADLDGTLYVFGKQQVIEVALTTAAWHEGNNWRTTQNPGGLVGYLLKAGPRIRRAKHFPLCKEPNLIILNYFAMLHSLCFKEGGTIRTKKFEENEVDDDEYPSICISLQVQRMLLSTLADHGCAHCRNHFSTFEPLLINHKDKENQYFAPEDFLLCWRCLTLAKQGELLELRRKASIGQDSNNSEHGIESQHTSPTFDQSTLRSVIDPYAEISGPSNFIAALRTLREIQFRQSASNDTKRDRKNSESHDVASLSTNLSAVNIG